MRSLHLALVVVFLFLSSCQIVTPSPTEPPGFAPSDPEPDAREKDEPMILHRNDLAWLVENSALVFLGRLVGQDVEKDERGLIITRNHFEIEKVLIGDFGEEKITLTTLGGTLGEQTLRVSHMPVFAEGRQYIIFTDPNRTTYDPITGNQDGVFVVGPEDLGVYSYDGISVAGVEEGIIQPGGLVLKEYFEQDPQGPSPLREDPDIGGDITSVERAEIVVQPAMPLDQFIEIVLSLSTQR